MTKKIGILVAKDIKCALNHNAIIQRLASIRGKREIRLIFKYGDDERSTKPARLTRGQDRRKKAYYTESLTFPIAKVAEEFTVTCYDAKDPNTILGITRDTLKNALNVKRPSDKDMDKGTKVKLELSRGGEIVGEVSFNLMFLAMEAPKEQMKQIELESLHGQTIGIMMIDKIKVKNRYGHKGHLRVILVNEMASTENYFTTTDKECSYGIILPVVAAPDLSIKLQINFSNAEIGSRRIYFEKDLWLKLMDGGQVSVPEILLYVGDNLAATVNLKISIHQPLNPLQLLPQEATLININESSNTNFSKRSLKLESDSNDDERKKISSQHSFSPPSTTAESLENSEDQMPPITQSPRQYTMSRQASTSFTNNEDQMPPITQSPRQYTMSRQTSTSFTNNEDQMPPITQYTMSRQTSTSFTNSEDQMPPITQLPRQYTMSRQTSTSFTNCSTPSRSTTKSLKSTNSIRRGEQKHPKRNLLNRRDTRDSSLRIISEKYLIMSQINAGPHITVNNNANSNRVYLTKNIINTSECICKEHFFQSSFSNETKYLKKLQSEHIVKWVDLVPYENGGGIIVLENFGESLDKVYFQFQKINNILQVFYNICEAVQFLHRHGVVHTDLCPSNIICAEPQRTNIRLCDLEHVRCVDEVIQFQQQALTIGFTPPEFFNQEEVLYAEFNQDIFGLGAILFFIYSKTLLYKDVNSSCREFDNRINEKISQDYISNIIIKSCKPNPEERCEISELCEDMKTLLKLQNGCNRQHSRGSNSNKQHTRGNRQYSHGSISDN